MDRLYHDFNKLLPNVRAGIVTAPLVCAGTESDLAKLRLTLTEGLEVILYQFDPEADGTPAFLEVQAKVRYSKEEGHFVADFVWDELKHSPDPNPSLQ